MRKLSQIWFEIQEVLFPFIEKKTEEPLLKKLKQLVTTLELIRIEGIRAKLCDNDISLLRVS